MDIALWVVQVLLALVFGGAGFAKATQPVEKLKARMGYVEDFSPQTVRLIGVLEILGAIGLLLPALTGILPWLTPLAAAGLVLTMIGAIIVHVRRNETAAIAPNIVLLLLALFIAYGRFALEPLWT